MGTIAKRKTSADIEVPDTATESEIEAAIRQDFLKGHEFKRWKVGQ
jgi:hypothetical protein